ncbi:DNA replication ATP-dependent helicase/nuclease DNA2-like [Haliotis rubra]|uniref:DNA replication ATP-dependent helicase/nuclease DNA2-like n=1 Tax=Haliotis rubra TaxID=36100 RepID=UPI001EE5A1AC|nr:DNA replication ATP-dependent helicase/nuclease DNA2-like [Haliotis rubra]
MDARTAVDPEVDTGGAQTMEINNTDTQPTDRSMRSPTNSRITPDRSPIDKERMANGQRTTASLTDPDHHHHRLTSGLSRYRTRTARHSTSRRGEITQGSAFAEGLERYLKTHGGIHGHTERSLRTQLYIQIYIQRLRHVEGVNRGSGHAMEKLVPETLGHLQQHHVDYYLHWCVCLELESRVARGSNITDIWCSSSHDREKKGDCLSGMKIKHTKMANVAESQRFAEGESCIVTFKRHPSHLRQFPAPLHTLGFSKNDSVAISSDDGRLLVLSSGFIYSIRVSFTRTQRCGISPTALTDVTTSTPYALFTTSSPNLSQVKWLLTNQHSREKLRELIIDRKKPEFQLTMSKGTIEKVKHIFKSLNKPQKAVILKILMCKDYVLIKGYPGTGKTSTIVALVRILNCLGLSVLLTSYTHSAVDNILLKLNKLNVNFLRLGRLGRIHPDLHDNAAEVLTSKITSVHELRTFYESQNIVATSCLGVNHPIFSQRRFDVCIVDEASQVLQPACLGPLFAADRFVLVGDPKQLPPVVQSREARELGMGESLFARLDDAGATFDLNLQYRMNKTIMHLSNELMYGGLLQCGSSEVAETCLVLPEPTVHTRPWLSQVLASDLQQAAIFLDTNKVPAPEASDGKGMLKNTVEAELVLIIVASLVKVPQTSKCLRPASLLQAFLPR